LQPEISERTAGYFRSRLVRWYADSRRLLPWRDTREPYRIWVSEVMLQQTQVATVIPYYFKFLDAFPTIYDLAAADLDRVLKLWEGLGYYARARNFHKAANVVISQFNGQVPDSWDDFITLPGIGPYIAAAVLSLAHDLPFAVVDGNVKRVLARFLCDGEPVNHSTAHRHYQHSADLLLDRVQPAVYNQAIMELGALICKPKAPDCESCPVSRACCAKLQSQTDQFPRRLKPKKIPTYDIAVGVVRKNGKLLITRRKLSGLLGGLWEFPGGKIQKGESAEQACTREIKEETGLLTQVTEHLTVVRHAYTHFKIRMDVFSCKVVSGRVRLNGPMDFRWISPDRIDDFAFPRANLKFIHLIRENKIRYP
jgi:A/G-specific adenine glycosylase